MDSDDAEQVESEMAGHDAILFSASGSDPKKSGNADIAKPSDLALG